MEPEIQNIIPPAAEPVVVAPIEAPEAIQEINLDALEAPEGASKDVIDLIGAAKPHPLDSTSPAAPATPSAEPVTPVTPETPAKPIPVAGKEMYQAVFNKLKEYTGVDTVNMPEDINDENFMEKLSDAIFEQSDIPEKAKLHPLVEKLQDSLDKGIPMKEAVKQLDEISYIDTASALDIMGGYLLETFGKTEENPNGWDDEKITETLDKMDKGGTLELEAEKIRQGLKQYKLQQLKIEGAVNAESQKAAITQQREKDSLERTALQKETLQKLNTMDNILGVPVSKADIIAFKDDFLFLTTPGEDGVSPGVKLLQSNDNFTQALYLLTRQDTIKAALSDAKEKTKVTWKKSLDLEPAVSTKVSDISSSSVDLDRLEQAESFIYKP